MLDVKRVMISGVLGIRFIRCHIHNQREYSCNVVTWVVRRASGRQHGSTMPRYFFNLIMDEETYPDAVGMDCSDTMAARREDLTALSQMMRDAIRTAENRRDLHMDVRDAERRIALTACVALTARWLE